MWEKLQDLDRRWIYLVFVIALLFPLFKPLGLPIKVGADVQNFYTKFDKLPAGAVVWLSPDYSPGASAELNPQFEAVLRHCFKNNYKLLMYSMWEQGSFLGRDIMERVAKELNKVHGVDWIYLGWRAGGNTVIRRASEDLWGAMENLDGYDKPLADSPLMANIRRLWTPDVDAIVCFSSGSPGDGDYMTYVTDPAAKEAKPVLLFTGQVAVQAPSRIPVIRSGQIQGMIPGMGGAAEYETLNKIPGKAAGLMDAQSLAHVVILAFIVLGNIAYLASRKK
ncbi:MAG: hypothetical protein Q8P31_00460 [Bacillota bacterium]|nr:hypothetical protein [Bacillota bacterium]